MIPRLVEVVPWQSRPLAAANDTPFVRRDAVVVGSSRGQSTIDKRIMVASILACLALVAAGLTYVVGHEHTNRESAFKTMPKT